MGAKKVTYKASGVDIGKADRFVDWVRAKTSGIGGFSALFPVPCEQYDEPMLVSGTDGVGTKILIAEKMRKYDTVGIDLVAMVVNDIVTCGARPLFFLDYYAVGKLEPEVAKQVLKGILSGCKQADCPLVGGETAELPGVYAKSKFDLAGFAVGIVEKKKVIDGAKIKKGKTIIGLASNGLHSNGFSLARHIFFKQNKLRVNAKLDDLSVTLGEELLRPTVIYARVIQALIEEVKLLGIANITGGGIEGNLCRILPNDCDGIIEKSAWDVLPVFKIIQTLGPVEDKEMFKTFNMGIGMTVVVNKKDADRVIDISGKHNIKAHVIGTVVKGKGKVILK